MTLLGKAAVAMWWDMAPAQRGEFEDWHSHEHFPERMSIPGFQRGSRWADAEGSEGFFVLYELADYETLTSAHYLARLNGPTPWSTRMMPHHRNMVRSQCRIVASFGGGVGRAMMTLRVSPRAGEEAALTGYLEGVLRALPQRPGLTGGHLLVTQTPDAGVTAEQKIRGGADAVADWIVLVSGYDADVLAQLGKTELGSEALGDAGAFPEQGKAFFSLSFAMTPNDL
jgi:hypothetical protein